MARTTKKGSNDKKATLRRPVVKTSVAEQAQTNAELRQQLAKSLQREEETQSVQLNEALGTANGYERHSGYYRKLCSGSSVGLGCCNCQRC